MIADLQLADDHPAFAGHFPGLPILPGAVLLDQTLAAIARARDLDLLEWQVASVKFLEIVRPGEPLRVEHESADDVTVGFTVRSGDRLIASGILTAAAAPVQVVGRA